MNTFHLITSYVLSCFRCETFHRVDLCWTEALQFQPTAPSLYLGCLISCLWTSETFTQTSIVHVFMRKCTRTLVDWKSGRLILKYRFFPLRRQWSHSRDLNTSVSVQHIMRLNVIMFCVVLHTERLCFAAPVTHCLSSFLPVFPSVQLSLLLCLCPIIPSPDKAQWHTFIHSVYCV